MKILIWSLLISLLSLTFSKQLNPKKVVTAINCGSSSGVKSYLGFFYQADKGFKGGRTADYTLNPEASGAVIKYTRDHVVYFSERHDDVSLRYDLDLVKPGKYVLILKFSEMKFTEKNQRTFHLRLGDRRIRDNVDPAGTVGRYAALDEYVAFELKNDMVYYNDQLCEGAYHPGNRKLSFELEKTDRDNPMIMGIVLYEGELEDTDFYEIPQMRENWEKKLNEEKRKKEEERYRKEAAKLKKREKVKVRNDHSEDFEDDFDDVFDVNDDDKSILRLLLSPTGLFVTFGGLIGVFVMLFLSRNASNNTAKSTQEVVFEEEKTKVGAKVGSQKKKTK